MTYDEVFLQAVPLMMLVRAQEKGLQWKLEYAQPRKLGSGRYEVRMWSVNGPVAVRVSLVGSADSETLWRLDSLGLTVGGLPDELRPMLYELLFKASEGMHFTAFLLEGEDDERSVFARCHHFVKGESMEVNDFLDRMLEVAARGTTLEQLAARLG